MCSSVNKDRVTEEPGNKKRNIGRDGGHPSLDAGSRDSTEYEFFWMETFSVLQALDSHFRGNDEVANLFCSLTLTLPTDTVFWPWIPAFVGVTKREVSLLHTTCSLLLLPIPRLLITHFSLLGYSVIRDIVQKEDLGE